MSSLSLPRSFCFRIASRNQQLAEKKSRATNYLYLFDQDICYLFIAIAVTQVSKHYIAIYAPAYCTFAGLDTCCRLQMYAVVHVSILPGTCSLDTDLAVTHMLTVLCGTICAVMVCCVQAVVWGSSAIGCICGLSVEHAEHQTFYLNSSQNFKGASSLQCIHLQFFLDLSPLLLITTLFLHLFQRSHQAELQAAVEHCSHTGRQKEAGAHSSAFALLAQLLRTAGYSANTADEPNNAVLNTLCHSIYFC